MEHVAVIGSSLAGLRACESLRQEGFTGRITLIGEETHMPYDRPPLSKKVLAGEWEPDRILLRKPDDFASLDLTWQLGVRATSLNGTTVGLADGTTIAADGAIIAVGAATRRLPNQPDWTHEVRTLDDTLRLREELLEGRRVVVIGAGFIGLEVAATARERGCDVVVLEGAPAPLIRGLGAEMGRAVTLVHGDHGVPIRCGIGVASIEPGAVVLSDGERVPADVVVVGIGVSPDVAWLEGSGLELRDGIVCDATMWTGQPGVYAAGDCARWINAGTEMRVEHWTNAAEQGAFAAKNLLAVDRGDEPTPYVAVPFFWSDQYDSRIQYLGRAGANDEVRVVHGSIESRKFTALYGDGERLTAALGVTSPRIVMRFRKLLVDGATWAEALELAASLPA